MTYGQHEIPTSSSYDAAASSCEACMMQITRRMWRRAGAWTKLRGKFPSREGHPWGLSSPERLAVFVHDLGPWALDLIVHTVRRCAVEGGERGEVGEDGDGGSSRSDGPFLLFDFLGLLRLASGRRRRVRREEQ